MKKRLCLVLAAAMALGLASFYAPPVSGRDISGDDPVANEDIDYTSEGINAAVRVWGQRNGAPIAQDDGFYIDLQTETLSIPETYRPAAFSVNNGGRWRPAGRSLNGTNFPRLLNKGMTLLLSDEPVDRTTGAPPEDADIISFAPILERPRPLRLIVNYAVRAAEPSGEGYPGRGRWALTEPGGEEPYNVQIAAASGNRIDSFGFGMFRRGTDDEIAGIPVSPSIEINERTRVVRFAFFWRLPPEVITPGELYQAAGRARRIAVTSEQRPPHIYEEVQNEDGEFIICAACHFEIVNNEVIIWRLATARRAASRPQVFSLSA